jgi:glycosyltransferase involved in cell wall biosynthesis
MLEREAPVVKRLRALVCSYYLPEPDRDSGSRRVLDHVEFLRDSGVAVEFAALNGFRDQRYVRGLARKGIAAHDAAVGGLECLIGGVEFDLVVFAFWQTAERYLPAIRRISPRSRVVVDSVDLQFLRDARGTFRAEDSLLSPEYGSNLVGELNVYAAADAVLTVSAKEAETIRDLLGEATLVTSVPDAEDIELSAIPFAERRGMLFQGGFQHTPNAGAVEFLCRKVVPILPPRLLEEHPLSVVGAGLDDTIRAYGSGNPNVRLVGWVPSVTPYLERARISVVPLLYGAGTKRKLIQSLIGGTPAVSTTVGIEGLDLVDGEHVLVADEEGRFAERIAELIEDAALWRRLQRRGRAAVLDTHGREAVRTQFLEAVAQTLARPAKPELLAESSDTAYASRMIYLENQKLVAPIRELLRTSVTPSATIAVLSDGSSELLRLRPWRTMHFPADEAGAYGGRPESVGDAISSLESCHERGADYLVVPSTAYWSGLYDALPTLSDELRSRYACVAQNHACTVYALGTHVPGDIGRIDAVPASAPPPLDAPSVRLVALYLPQFHPIPENDAWWGEGFTEWNNVSSAKPLFPGHYQPHVPADLGFYDLRLPETRQAQADLAREFGIHGFCYYHYWFHGKELLERPFAEVLASGEPDFPFCLCWANEPWSRRWDGREDDVLQPQRYSQKDDLAHIRSLLPALGDRRAITIAGRPLFIVYQARDLPDPARTVDTWRREVEREGLGEPYLVAVETGWDEGWDATTMGFDAKLMFRPQFTHLRKTPWLQVEGPDAIEVHDYGRSWPALAAPEPVSYPHYEMVCPSWDNSPRAGERAVVLHDSTPAAYGEWLAEVLDRAARRPEEERLVFVNAWNEWAEGCHLEPDQKHGRAYLEATREALVACASASERGNGAPPPRGTRAGEARRPRAGKATARGLT